MSSIDDTCEHGIGTVRQAGLADHTDRGGDGVMDGLGTGRGD